VPRSLGPVVPAPLAALIDGRDLAAASGHTFILLTAAEGDWPHAALLSAGEVLLHHGRLRLGLWPDSATTANLTGSGRATLLAVVPPATYDLRLRAGRRPDITVGGRLLAHFEADVVEVIEDVVAYATVTAGITFDLADREATLASWSECLSAMRSA